MRDFTTLNIRNQPRIIFRVKTLQLDMRDASNRHHILETTAGSVRNKGQRSGALHPAALVKNVAVSAGFSVSAGKSRVGAQS